MHFLLLCLVLSQPVPEPPVKPTFKQHLPAFRTPGELARDSSSQLLQFMMAHPELYAVTVPPPPGFVMYAEFDAVDTMYLVYEDAQRTYYVNMIEAATATVDVVIWHSNEEASIRNVLQSRLSSAAMSRVGFVDFYPTPHYAFTSPYPIDSAVDSIWAVDFGPFFVRNAQDRVAIVDPQYYFERINDNAIATKMGDVLGMSAYRPDLQLEGGNLFSDGMGTCYSTIRVHEANPRYNEFEIDEIMHDYFGCEKMIWLEPLSGEGTGHIDMFFILASPVDVVVGSFLQSQDSTNRAVMDQNAARLATETNAAGVPLVVHRIPMPNPGNDYWGRIWRTYTNGLRLNDRYLVPTYNEHTAYQVEALTVLEAAMPGVTLVNIPSDNIIPWGGAIHCTTRSKPVGLSYLADSPPAWLCGGAPYCDQCISECLEGETGCMENGNRYICGNTDMDVCLEKIELPCPSFAQCSEGHCGDDTCTDACLPWEIGCVDNATRFVCAEAGDGDMCIDPVPFGCGLNRTCTGGICIPSSGGCGSITYDGECQQDISVYCDEGELVVDDCREEGMTCGWVASEGYYDCVPHKACQDECEIGERQCVDGETELLVCAESFDGDRCLEWKSLPCDDGLVCREDACRVPCGLPCEEGESICTDSGHVSVCVWNDETGCMEMQEEPCEEGYMCKNGECVTLKKKSDGCSCSAGGRSPATPGLLFFMLALMGLVTFRRFTS